MIFVEDYVRVSWDCVRFLAEDEAASLRLKLKDSGLLMAELCGSDLLTRDALFSGMASALAFPDYFGMNWDALDECLRDLDDWAPAQGYVLVIREATSFWTQAPKLAGKLVESWQFCAGEWAGEGKPFHLVFVW